MAQTIISPPRTVISLSSSSSSQVPPSPINGVRSSPASNSSSSSSASSSRISLGQADEENVTITAGRVLSKKLGKQKSQEDLRILAVSTNMTELSYVISDIQTRIFEIQELRHKSHSSGDAGNTTTVIDQSLVSLDERLESVEKGMKAINETLEPVLRNAPTPTMSSSDDAHEHTAILRKHDALLAEWQSVQHESEVLREELKEDKWLTVFRTVTDQADGMMSSLEKAVNRCQEFIWQVHRRGEESSLGSHLSTPHRGDKPQISFEVFATLLESYEAKKKHYMPATSKVLSIIDKGVRDRVTKNGETLRRHAESAQRWKNLRERINRTDGEMESVRKILLSGELSPSENGSSTSGTMSTRNGYLATPPNGGRMSRAPSSSTTISRSMSPLRKIARKLTGNRHGLSQTTHVTPLNVNKLSTNRQPSSEPQRTRNSFFNSLKNHHPAPPLTPERPSHKYSQSLTPDSSPRAGVKVDNSTTNSNSKFAPKQRWNSSTKVEVEARTVRGTTPKRPPSATGIYGSHDDPPPLPSGYATPYKRSLSRASMTSSRPWSPVTSSISTNPSSAYPPPLPSYRPGSRAQTPSNGLGLSVTTPRPRPKTPSHIPAPPKGLRSISGTMSDAGWDDDDQSPLRRTFSPTFSTSGASVSGTSAHPPRPPSRSMIPVPSVHLSSASRPSSSMSNYYRSESPSNAMGFRSTAMRAQTPDAFKARTRPPNRPLAKAPPSSFNHSGGSGGGSGSGRTPSRPASRTGAFTPSGLGDNPHEYTARNPRDPLDVEIAIVVNSIPHGLLIERVDPPLKAAPKDGEEIKAQYAFSNISSRKVVTCRLTTLTRAGKAGTELTTKKVMCRVGGGWQDLTQYILNRQAGA